MLPVLKNMNKVLLNMYSILTERRVAGEKKSNLTDNE